MVYFHQQGEFRQKDPSHAILIGGMQMYPTGGYEYLNHPYRFDFDTQRWRHTGRSLSETKGFPQVVTFDGSLAILGGHSYQENTEAPVRTFEMLSEGRISK